jgi:hypothetical protein
MPYSVDKMNPRQLQAYYNSQAYLDDRAEIARMEREAKEAKEAEVKAAIARVWSEENTSSSTEPSPYDPPRLGAYLYHCSRPDSLGPKLVYRTSRDKESFTPPAGPDAPRRLMKLHSPPRDHRFARDNLWGVVVGPEVSLILDLRASAR